MEVIVVVELTKDIALFVNVWNLMAAQMVNPKKFWTWQNQTFNHYNLLIFFQTQNQIESALLENSLMRARAVKIQFSQH